MAVEIKVPEMGESVSSAFLASWLAEEGSVVEEGTELCELESDKATMTVPSPAAGVFHQGAKLDSEVAVGEVIGSIDTEGTAAKAAPATKASDSAESDDATGDEPAEYSPAVRRLLAEHTLDPASIHGSGKEGRITKEDVLSYLNKTTESLEKGVLEKAVTEPKSSGSSGPKTGPEVSTGLQGTRETRRVPVSRIRRTIAANLVASKQQSAHLTTFNEIDMSRVIALRKELGEDFLKEQGVKLGFMSFFVKAACAALLHHREVNAAIDGDEMVYHDYCDIGIAVSTERGLVVPVLRNAEGMSFAAIENAIVDFGERARAKRLSVDEMSGGTFTITNGGIFGSLLSTPIPTPPQTAVLGMHTIQKRPVAVDDQVVIRPMMYVALTYDHRIIDGKEAVGFLGRIKRSLENPDRMLVEV